MVQSGFLLYQRPLSDRLWRMKAYSIDLHGRVTKAIEAGKQSQAKVVETFGIGLRTIETRWHRWRETQSVAALPHGGGPTRVLAKGEAASGLPIVMPPQRHKEFALIPSGPSASRRGRSR